jgi:hypothetical protein
MATDDEEDVSPTFTSAAAAAATAAASPAAASSAWRAASKIPAHSTTVGRSVSHGAQAWREVEGFIQSGLSESLHAELEGQTRAPVGLPVQHHSALQQCTGEAEYVDDIHKPFGTVQ